MNSLLLEPAQGATTLGQLYREAENVLRRAGVAAPSLDARLIVCAACGLTHEQYAAEPMRQVAPVEAASVRRMCRRRLAGEPVSRILGHREFYGLDFRLSPETLDPRCDTETIVEETVKMAKEMIGKGRQPVILDLGTGTGCILISVLRECPNATGLGIDIDPAAVETARDNAVRLNVADRARFVCCDWLAPLACSADIVVSNPPYIPSAEIGSLAREVAQFDPRRALDGGSDGLDAYRKIAERLEAVLNAGGAVVVEAGDGQAPFVLEILQSAGFGITAACRRRGWDLAGRWRCVVAQRG